jgi:hypothetical protein
MRNEKRVITQWDIRSQMNSSEEKRNIKGNKQKKGERKMGKVYVFKVQFKHRKSLWRRIEIIDSQTLGDFDRIIREGFSHSDYDHLSEFFTGQAWKSRGFGEIMPDGSGIGSKQKINQMGLTIGSKFEYVYDFGDDLQHVLTLEKIIESDEEVTYPRIAAKNKPKYHYCESCRDNNKKVIATWICHECIEYLCEDCLDAHDEECYIDEVVY